jgi:Micrococcal nuclease (thermonuclease) homologs
MSSPLSRLAGLLLVLAVFSGAAAAGTLSILGNSRPVQVRYVFDGDTFETAAGERIRLLGINAPEVAHPERPGQVMGIEATKALAGMIAGKTVRLEFDAERHDVYGRTLAQVYLPDGTWVNGEMLRRGLAHAYIFTPNLRWARELVALERTARKKRLGIWRTRRFRELEATRVTARNIGQFRVVHGRVTRLGRSRFYFRLGRLGVSVPRSFRRWFSHPPRLRRGQTVIVHGVIRRGRHGGLYMALHSPADLETLSP